METTELRLVLENCFTPAVLKEFLRECPAGYDPYALAADAILSEDETGVKLALQLDHDSERQRVRIRSMSPKELRNHLTFEFLEPGRTLGHIVWALLRDDRIGARTLAAGIANYFGNSHSQPAPALPPTPTESAAAPGQEMELEDLDLSDETLNEIMDEVGEITGKVRSDAYEETTTLELPDEDTELEQLLSDFSEEEMPELSFSDSEADQTDRVTVSPTMEIEFPVEEIEEVIDDQLELDADSIQEVESLIADLAVTDIELEEGEFNPPILEMAAGREDKIPPGGIQKEPFSPTSPLVETPSAFTREKPQPPVARETASRSADKPEDFIVLGGVELSLASLKRACERVFQEPVELVSDSNLTRQDKIVVIGKQCGVKVLYGPGCAIRAPEIPIVEKEGSVPVSSASIQSALSRIYGEPVELIPDGELLENGIIPFAGIEIGILILENPRLKVSLPDWAETDALQADSAPPLSNAELTALKNQIAYLEQRIRALEQTPPPRPAAEGTISDQAIALDELETEELEPIVNNIVEVPPVEEGEVDLMAAIAAQEQEEQKEDAIAEEEIDLSDLNLEEVTDDVEAAEEESVSTEEINLDDLNLDEIVQEGLGEEIKMEDLADNGVGLSVDEISEEELDLDILSELGEEEEKPFEPKKVYNGELILLLGGAEKNKSEYYRIVEELGGTAEWYAHLQDQSDEEIAEIIERADLIMTLSSEAMADPGILKAKNIAHANNKRLFQHHSAGPANVQKQLAKLVAEGKV